MGLGLGLYLHKHDLDKALAQLKLSISEQALEGKHVNIKGYYQTKTLDPKVRAKF